MTARTMPPIIFPLSWYTEKWSHDPMIPSTTTVLKWYPNVYSGWLLIIKLIIEHILYTGYPLASIIMLGDLAQKYLKEVFNLSDYLMGNYKYLLIKNNFWSQSLADFLFLCQSWFLCVCSFLHLFNTPRSFSE